MEIKLKTLKELIKLKPYLGQVKETYLMYGSEFWCLLGPPIHRGGNRRKGCSCRSIDAW